MNASRIRHLAEVTLSGTIAFPEIVAQLMAEGVEYYHVDYASLRFTFYGESGGVITAPLTFEGLPGVADAWNRAELQRAILDSQQHGQPYRQFCTRAMAAGVQAYYAFLRGKQVLYLGRQGDQHVEWFPGAHPEHEA